MKDYFEISEAERRLTLISNTLNYFAVVMAEGIVGDYKDLEISEVIKLQGNACSHILEALKDVDKMLKAVQEDKP